MDFAKAEDDHRMPVKSLPSKLLAIAKPVTQMSKSAISVMVDFLVQADGTKVE